MEDVRRDVELEVIETVAVHSPAARDRRPRRSDDGTRFKDEHDGDGSMLALESALHEPSLIAVKTSSSLSVTNASSMLNSFIVATKTSTVSGPGFVLSVVVVEGASVVASVEGTSVVASVEGALVVASVEGSLVVASVEGASVVASVEGASVVGASVGAGAGQSRISH
jgi:hypothetical protein